MNKRLESALFALAGIELGIYAPVSLPFLIMDSLVSEGISRW